MSAAGTASSASGSPSSCPARSSRGCAGESRGGPAPLARGQAEGGTAVLGRAGGELLGVLSPLRRQEADRRRDERRLVAAAAVRDGGEERRVRLDENPVAGHEAGRFLDIGRLGEGRDPRERNVEAE